jgi:hypothetical protein
MINHDGMSFDMNVMAHYSVQLEQTLHHGRDKHGVLIVNVLEFDRALIEFMQYAHNNLPAPLAHFGLAVFLLGAFESRRISIDMAAIKLLSKRCFAQCQVTSKSSEYTSEKEQIEQMLEKLEKALLPENLSKGCEFASLLIERMQHAHTHLPALTAHAVIAVFVRGILNVHDFVSYGSPS